MASTRIYRSFLSGKSLVQSSSSSSSTSPKMFPLWNAATEESRGFLECANASVVSQAIAEAKIAQIQWAKTPPAERGAILYRAADLLYSMTAELAQAETLDTGRVIDETLVTDITSACDCLRYYASAVVSSGQTGQTVMGLGEGGVSWGYTRREPWGVTAGIGAWNYPLQSAAWKASPALACGNAMVFKPSELTPSSALVFAQTLITAGVPPGVFQVVLGTGCETGAALVTHPGIAKISFTGSVETGKHVYAQAASQLKQVTMELGGKSPLIIFSDADIEASVSAAMMANWYSNGQVCSNGTRVFVHADVKDQFIQRLVKRTAKMRMGNPLERDVDIGPMVTKEHQEKVLAYIEKGVDEGATLVYGHANLDMHSQGPHWPPRGYYLLPTIFTDCTDDMTIVREEIFGMVMTILDFDTEEEVIARANATDFGLSAGVMTQNIARGHRVVQQLEAGTTWINNYNLAPVELPWGGYKYSGIGRENGTAGIESWSQIKSVYVEMSETVDCPYPL